MGQRIKDNLDKQSKQFKDYVKDKKIVIVDPQASSRAALAKTLVDLGVLISQIELLGNYDDAEASIARQKPHVLIADYELGKGRCGLDLLQSQRTSNPDSKHSLFVLVTGNTSQSAVAQAAEEDVDAFILKPYTLEVLRNTLLKTAVNKMFPNQYIATIEKGKEELAGGRVDEALAFFDKATAYDPKPALALFYHGQAEFVKKTLSNAESDYNKGLSYSKIHYKCMTGLFDLFMEQKRNKEAYEIVRKIARYFPANPERLASVLRLAVVNKAYEDIERYYQLFCSLDQRNEKLIRYVCAALVVCGKYYIQNKMNARAVELFTKASVTGVGQLGILKEILTSMIKAGLQADAVPILKRWPSELQGTEEFHVLKFLVEEKSEPIGVSIQRAREYIHAGVKDPLLHQTLIERSLAAGLKEPAITAAQDAAAIWPDQAKVFLSLVGLKPKS